MKYDKLTEEQQEQILANTLLDIEQQHFAASLALKRAQAIGDEGQVNAFTEQIANLEKQREALG